MPNLNYTPLLLGFILDFRPTYDGEVKNSRFVQKALVDLVEKYTEPEDRLYLYAETRLRIPKKKHLVLSQACNFNPDNVNLVQAIEQTYRLLSCESDYRRYVVCLTDAFSKRDVIGVRRVQAMDARDFSETGFVFFGIGDKYEKSFLETINHPYSFYYHCDTLQQFPERIIELVKSLTKSEVNNARDVSDAGQLQGYQNECGEGATLCPSTG